MLTRQAKRHNWTFWNKIKKQNILYVSPKEDTLDI